MSCDGSCETPKGPNCLNCKGYNEIDACVLIDFRKCEPWCYSAAPCEVLPNCSDGSCPAPGRVLSPLSRLLLAGVQGGCFEVCTVDGKAGFRPKGGTECIISLDEANCGRFGSHFNMERRASDVSPAEAEALAKKFAYEAGSATAYRIPGTNWYVAAIGCIGLSHQFCVTETSLTYVTGTTPATITVAPVGVGVGGERIACGDGDDDSPEGFYTRVGDTPNKADPEALKITDGRCACDDLCARTPARGLEFVYVQVSDDDALPVDATQITITFKVKRCAWMVLVEPCVGPKGNRPTTVDLLFGGGNIPACREAESSFI